MRIIAILKDVLTQLYIRLGASLLVTVFFMVVYVEAGRIGWKQVMKNWINYFKNEKQYRKVFY